MGLATQTPERSFLLLRGPLRQSRERQTFVPVRLTGGTPLRRHMPYFLAILASLMAFGNEAVIEEIATRSHGCPARAIFASASSKCFSAWGSIRMSTGIESDCT